MDNRLYLCARVQDSYGSLRMPPWSTLCLGEVLPEAVCVALFGLWQREIPSV